MQGAGIIEWNNFGLFSQLHKSRILSVARYASVSELVHSKNILENFYRNFKYEVLILILKKCFYQTV